MITRAEAVEHDHFHYYALGASKCYVWRRNGRTQEWKRDASRFRVPIKWGMYSYGALASHDDLTGWYTPLTCPACRRERERNNV